MYNFRYSPLHDKFYWLVLILYPNLLTFYGTGNILTILNIIFGGRLTVPNNLAYTNTIICECERERERKRERE